VAGFRTLQFLGWASEPSWQRERSRYILISPFVSTYSLSGSFKDENVSGSNTDSKESLSHGEYFICEPTTDFTHLGNTFVRMKDGGY
jgi:hypothetical protein